MQNESSVHFVGTSFVLAVPNAERSARYWCEVLGFKLQMTPPGWHFVVRDLCRVMLGECPADMSPADLGSHSYFGYIEVTNLDAYHDEIAARGAIITSSPADKPWGMRERAVRTPDGHRVMFGQSIAPQRQGPAH